MRTTTSKYDVQAQAWADKYGVTMTATFTGHRKHFTDDTDTRDTYSITLTRDNRSMTFGYGQSIVDSRLDEKLSNGPAWTRRAREYNNADNWMKAAKIKNGRAPTLYDVLTCIEKHEPGTFEQWCGDFGADTDSRKALDTYLAVQKEHRDFANLCSGAPGMLEDAREIQ